MTSDEQRARKAADQRRARARRPRAVRAPGESSRWDRPYRVLSDAEVAEMRALHASGSQTQRALAERYGIHASHVSRLVRRYRR